jgi:hypothetical protein
MGWLSYDPAPEEDMFRRVSEGWVFTIGGKWSYLANDAQKAELLVRLVRGRFVSFLPFTVMVAPVPALCGSLLRSGFPDWIHFAALAVATALSALLLFKVAIPYFQLFILQPILADTVPVASATTPARVGLRASLSADIQRQAQIWSVGGLTLVCVAFGWVGIKSGYAALTSKGTFLDAFAMVLLAVYFGVVLFAKLRQRRLGD